MNIKRKNILKIKPLTIIIILSSIAFSGCTEYLIKEFMSGPDSCKPGEMNKVVSNRRAIRHIANGLNREYVIRVFGNMPDKTEMLNMNNGDTYIVDYYKTDPGKICGGKTKHGSFKRIIYNNGVVIGSKENFFKQQVKPYILNSKIVN